MPPYPGKDLFAVSGARLRAVNERLFEWLLCANSKYLCCYGFCKWHVSMFPPNEIAFSID